MNIIKISNFVDYFRNCSKEQLKNIIENEFGLWPEEDIKLAQNELNNRL